MVDVARQTSQLNGATASVAAAVLQNSPSVEEASFYLRQEFWDSSLVPGPAATEVKVPVLDLAAEFEAHQPSYLIVDIKGGNGHPRGRHAHMRSQDLCRVPSLRE